MRGEARGEAAARRSGPEVAGVGEDDAVAVDVGEAQQLRPRLRRRRGEGERQSERSDGTMAHAKPPRNSGSRGPVGPARKKLRDSNLRTQGGARSFRPRPLDGRSYSSR